MSETIRTALEVLSKMDEDSRAKVYVEANRMNWPECLSAIKPEGWDELLYAKRHTHPEFRDLWRVIHLFVSPFARSRQWWRDSLEKPDGDHCEWWVKEMTTAFERDKAAQQEAAAAKGTT